jgi:two-component system, cell cycle response regulator
MNRKQPETIRFPRVPSTMPPSHPPSSPGTDERDTERALSIPRPTVRDRAGLTLLTGPSAGEVFTIERRETTIGRDEDAHIRPDDAAISRKHARIVRSDNGDFVLSDLGSTNGTYVGAEAVTSRVLRSGDHIQMGPNLIYRFAVTDEAEEQLQRQLFESSIRDPLTQAYNRKYLMERLAAELAHARRHKSNLALLLLDLDEFKSTNDQHGHLAGDAVLRQVAQAVRGLIRLEDVFARYGGEEFVVLMRGDGPLDAAHLAERLRKGIAAVSTPYESVQIAITVSIGVAELSEFKDSPGALELIEKADLRLYRAKAEGRNRVERTDA